MACNVPRQVAATYSGLWTKVLQNAEHLKLGITKKRFKGLDKAPKYSSRTCPLNYGRDYSFVKGKVSVITLQGRIKVEYQGYHKHLDLVLSGKATYGAAKIWYNKSTKTYYLLVSIEVEVPELNSTDIKRVMGVDVGRRYLAVVTDTKNQTQFFSGKSTVHKAGHYQRVRKRLQQKGTRSAKRRLKAIAGRERRFTADVNHCLAKQIVTPNTLIGLESLTNIRERTKPKNQGKKASKKQRKANRNQAKWAFAELHSFIDYKAIMSGSIAVKVDADYTSRSCPKCGHTHEDNRPGKGLVFHCMSCGFTLHADSVA